MDAIKLLTFSLIFIPIISFGQKSIYPKDTIYVLYEEIKDADWNAKFERKYNQKLGIYFNVETKKGDMTLFAPYSRKADTLCIKHLKDYRFSDLEEIEEKKNNWINKKFNGLKYKPYSGSKNGVFQTYLIEVISENKFVIYPVIWRNERI
jgi:hypothetical protein